MAKKIVLIEDLPLKTCVGCRTCELACSFEHDETFNPKKSRIRIARKGPAISYPVVCVQCLKAPCMEACPTKAIVRDPKTNAVVVREDLCNGCGACIPSCPFNAIFMHPEKNIAIKCDLCGGRLACIKYCPQRVLRYTEQGG